MHEGSYNMSEDRYEPYQYGEPEEPQFAEPDLLDELAKNDQGDSEVEEKAMESEEAKSEQGSPTVPKYDYSSYETQQTERPSQNPNSKGGFKTLKVIGLAVLFGVVASAVFSGSNYLFEHYLGGSSTKKHSEGQQEIDATTIVEGTGTSVESNIADVADGVMPSVVSITNISIQEVRDYFFGGTTRYEVPSSGSGIIVGQNDAELLIATNNHVVEGSETLTVAFIDGTSVNAQIKGTDSDIDLAIISVSLAELKKETLDAIKIAVLGDSDALRVGEPTIAIGNALGYGQSVTAGIASALGTTIEGYEGKLIQTDAAINPGNSGGALLNANGEVIGINTAKIKDESVEGMGYAIPISDVLDTLKELMNKETRTKVPEDERGYIGIEPVSVTAEMSQYYDIPKGVYVSNILEGSAAEKAELPLYCVITEVEGYDVDTVEELQEQLQYYRAGEKIELTIMVQNRKGYEKEKIEITLGKAN